MKTISEKKTDGVTEAASRNKTTAQRLKDSELKYRRLFEAAQDGILILNGDTGRIIDANPFVAGILGYRRNELLGKYLWDIGAFKDINASKMAYLELQSVNYVRYNSLPLETKDKRLIDVEFVSNAYKVNGSRIIQCNIRDITERKSRDLEYRTIISAAVDGFWLNNMQGHLLDVNQAYCLMSGYTYDELVNMTIADIEVIERPEEVASHIEKIKEVGHDHFETRHRRKDGVTFDVEISSHYLPIGGGRTCVFCRDITQRKKSEDAIRGSKLLLQTAIDATPDGMCVKNLEHRFLLVNKRFAESLNTIPQNMIGKADTEFSSEELCLGNPDKGIRGYHRGDNQAFQGRVMRDPRNAVTWTDGTQHIYDTYKIPLTDQLGLIYGVLVYNRDMTEQAKAEEQREVAYESLRHSLHNMIDTMAKVVEMRDPYTAGHQRRVADLASAIAQEMKLDDSRIEHIVMAAKIHDIGKMYVPSDILSKPGKLTDMEFSLIRTHAQGSFDIIKSIEFTQPVALMTLQHHERLDGSGYPNGLKGDAIMIESRILAVADVVEAMASHRPYRAALGIESALEEISKNKGKLYDADVVDACLELFNSGKFEFKSV